MTKSRTRRSFLRSWKQKACRFKRKYENAETAEKALADMLLHTGNTGTFEVYKCLTGNHYHFGHKITHHP